MKLLRPYLLYRELFYRKKIQVIPEIQTGIIWKIRRRTIALLVALPHLDRNLEFELELGKHC